MIIPYGTGQIVQLDSFYVIGSPLSVTDYPLSDAPDSPTWQFLCHR